MKRTLKDELEMLVRHPEQTNYNAIILEVALDTVLVKTPPGAKRAKRTVLLSEHIKAKRHLLKPGIPCQLEKRQDGLYVIAIFEEGIDLPTAYTAISDNLPTSPGQEILLQTPRPQAKIDCEQAGWVISWDAIENATGYEIYWSADETSRVADAGEPVATTSAQPPLGNETEALVAFDTLEPPRIFFAVCAIAQNGLKGPYSPWVTDEFSLQQPAGFTACPVPGGYRLDVDLAQDMTHASPAFNHWEVEWADDASESPEGDDEEGANGEVVIESLLPDDLPRFISAQAPGNWTFDSSADESWGRSEAASPGEWSGEGHTGPGSRILYEAAEMNSEIPEASQWFGGSIEQPMDQFNGRATDQLTLWVKLDRSSGSGSFPAKARLNAGFYDTTHVDLTTGGRIEEPQYHDYDEPPYEYVGFTAVGSWQELTLTLPAEAIGKPIGYLRIKIQEQGVPLTAILVDDIHWGPGGLQPAKQKWFRLRAITCAGIASEWTEWVSGWADLIVFSEPDNHGNIGPLDSRKRYRVQGGAIYETVDGLNYTELAGIPDPPNTWNDSPAPTAGDLDYIQIIPDPASVDTWYVLARRDGGGQGRGYILQITWSAAGNSYEWHPLGSQVSGGNTIQNGNETIFTFHDTTGWLPYFPPPAGGYDTTSTHYTATGTECPAIDPAVLQGYWSGANPNSNYLRFGFESTFKMSFPVSWSSYAPFYHYLYQPTWPGACAVNIYIYSSPDKETWTEIGRALIGEVGGCFNGRHTQHGYIGPHENVYLRIYYDCYKTAGCSSYPTKIFGFSVVDLVITPPNPIYPLWMDLNGERLVITTSHQGQLEVVEFDVSSWDRSSLDLGGVYPLTQAQITEGVFWAGPRFTPSGDLLLFGRYETEDETVIQLGTVVESTGLVKLVSEAEWGPESSLGSVGFVPPERALLVRHTAFSARIQSITDHTLIFELPEGNEAATLKEGMQLINLTKKEGGIVETLDLLNDTIILSSVPIGWAALDEIFVSTAAELWQGSIGNLTEEATFSLAIPELPLTVEPDGLAVNRSQIVMLGNRRQDTVMLQRIQPPYTEAKDATDEYAVGTGVVVLKWAESGCAPEDLPTAGTIPILDNAGNQVGIVLPRTGQSDGGAPVIVAPPAGTNQPPQFRSLHHHELVGLTNDDHPHYLTQARGDARYSQLGHSHDDRYFTETELQTSGQAQVHWDNVIGEPAAYPPLDHTHDDRYYTEGEVDTALAGKSDAGHIHDDRYYTETEVDALIAAGGGGDDKTVKADASDAVPGTLMDKFDFGTGFEVAAYDAGGGNRKISLDAAQDVMRWASLARPGPTRLYRSDNDSGYNVQTTYVTSPDGVARWLLQGYSGDTFHQGCRVAYANTADTVDGKHEQNLRGRGTYIYTAVSQTLPYNTYTTLTFAGGGYLWNESSGWDGATKLTAQETGWFQVFCQYTLQGPVAAFSDYILRLLINGSVTYGGEAWQNPASNGGTIFISLPVYLTSGQYVQFQAFQLPKNPSGQTNPNQSSRYTVASLVRL